MLQRIGIGLLWGIGFSGAGAFAAGYLISVFSSNQHDLELEAAMTGAFVFGPLAGMIGLAVGLWRNRKK